MICTSRNIILDNKEEGEEEDSDVKDPEEQGDQALARCAISTVPVTT